MLSSQVFLSFMFLWCWEVIALLCSLQSLLEPISDCQQSSRYLADYPMACFYSQPLVTPSLCFQFLFFLELSGESWSTRYLPNLSLSMLACGFPGRPGVFMHLMLSALHLLGMWSSQSFWSTGAPVPLSRAALSFLSTFHYFCGIWGWRERHGLRSQTDTLHQKLRRTILTIPLHWWGTGV